MGRSPGCSVKWPAASHKAKEFVHETATGPASCPTVGNIYDKLIPLRL